MKDEDFKNIMSSIDVDVGDMDDIDIINLEDEMEADIVYQTRDLSWLKYFLIIPIGALIFAIFVGSIALTQVKIVPSNVIGADYNIGSYSIVPIEYKASSKDIVTGSKVIIADSSDAFIGPLMKNYEIAEIGKITNQSVYIIQEGTKDMRKIAIFDIMYVLNNENIDTENDTKASIDNK